MSIIAGSPAAQGSFVPDRELAARPGDRAAVVALWIFLVAGAALRVYGLNRFPFEQDELYTEIESRLLYHSPLQPGIEGRPFYYLLQHVLLGVMPPTHASLRLLPILFGIAGVAATWALARKVLGNVAAIVAVALVTFSPWHLYVSGMGRYWSLIYLLSALFALFLVDAYQSERRRSYALALLALVLGTLTHPTFVFAAAGLAAGVTLVCDDGSFGIRWPTKRAWIHLWLPYAVMLAAGYLALKLAQEEAALRNWGGRGWLATLRLVPAIADYATPVLAAAAVLGAFALIGQKSALHRRCGLMALTSAMLCVSALLVASLVPSVYADYAVSVLPMMIVSAAGLPAIAVPRLATGVRWVTAAFIIIVLAGMSTSTASYLSDGNRFEYRPAFQRIAAEAPSVPVVTAPIILQRHYAPALRGIELRFSRQFLDSTLATHRDLWMVIPVRRYGIWQDDTGEVVEWLAKNCRLVSSHLKSRLDYRTYRTDLYRCGADGEG